MYLDRTKAIQQLSELLVVEIVRDGRELARRHAHQLDGSMIRSQTLDNLQGDIVRHAAQDRCSAGLCHAVPLLFA